MESELPSSGLQYLNRALKLHPFDTQARLFRGMIHHKMEKWVEALEDYDLAIAFGPEETAYLNRAVVKMDASFSLRCKHTRGRGGKIYKLLLIYS